MWGQFIFINIHFALNVVAALIFFMVSWLYFDSWAEHRALKNTFKISGFVLLALSFRAQAVMVDSSALGATFIPGKYIDMVGLFLRFFGICRSSNWLITRSSSNSTKDKGAYYL